MLTISYRGIILFNTTTKELCMYDIIHTLQSPPSCTPLLSSGPDNGSINEWVHQNSTNQPLTNRITLFSQTAANVYHCSMFIHIPVP